MTTTTERVTPADLIGLHARLEPPLTRVMSNDPTLTDIATVLHLLGTVEDVNGLPVQALCYLAARALGKYSGWVRDCPPAALNDLVASALGVCQAPSCDEDSAPWLDGSTCGSPVCDAEYARAYGEA